MPSESSPLRHLRPLLPDVPSPSLHVFVLWYMGRLPSESARSTSPLGLPRDSRSTSVPAEVLRVQFIEKARTGRQEQICPAGNLSRSVGSSEGLHPFHQYRSAGGDVLVSEVPMGLGCCPCTHRTSRGGCGGHGSRAPLCSLCLSHSSWL